MVTAAGDHFYQRHPKAESQHQRDGPPDHVQQHASSHAVGDSPPFACPCVLTGVGCHAVSQGKAGDADQFKQLAAPYLGGDVDLSQSVDASLKDDAANVVDSVHQRHAQARA